MASKYADRVFAKSKGEPEPKSEAASEPAGDEDAEDAGRTKDNEDGRQFRAALKGGDNSALCEAIRRICNS